MKIVFNYSSLGNGGAERCMVALANYCVNNGDNVTIIVNSARKNDHPLSPLVNVISFDNDGFSKKLSDVIKRNINEIVLLRKSLKEIKPDVIFAFSARNAVLCKLASFKSVVIGAERSNPIIERTSRKELAFVRMSNYLNGFVFQTTGAKEFYPKGIQKKSVVIPNGIAGNIQDIEYTDWENRPAFSFCATGRLCKVKRYDLLLEAMKTVVKQYPDVCLNIYGDGDLRESITEQIKADRLENNVYLKGHTKHIYEELCKHRYFLLSSDNEGMPNGLIDAMASGCVCISTDCDFGPRDLICNGENGYLLPCGDSDKIAETMIRLLKTENAQSDISKKALSIREELSGDKIFKRYYDYINSRIAR